MFEAGAGWSGGGAKQWGYRREQDPKIIAKRVLSGGLFGSGFLTGEDASQFWLVHRLFFNNLEK